MAQMHDIGRISTPPSLKDLEAIAREAYAGIPAELRHYANSVAIRVEDFPDDETMEDMECERVVADDGAPDVAHMPRCA